MKNKILKRTGIIALLLSFVFSLTMNVNAQSAILKTVKASGDNVQPLWTEQTEDQSYMNLSITNVDQSNNTITVTLKISNKGGTVTEITPGFNISMPNDFAKYFDVTFTQDNSWTLDSESNTTGTVSGDTAVGANFKYNATAKWDNSESATADFVYTIKLKDGVNADDLVGTTFAVAKEVYPEYAEATAELGLAQTYGPGNETCAIPTFTFVKPEENKKTGITSNVMLIGAGVFALCLIVVNLSKKGKMTRI